MLRIESGPKKFRRALLGPRGFDREKVRAMVSTRKYSAAGRPPYAATIRIPLLEMTVECPLPRALLEGLKSLVGGIGQS